MSEVATLDNAFDNILEAVNSGDKSALMAISGQSEVGGDSPKQGLARLNINYETETDEGQPLKRGAWKVYHEGEFVYADTVTFKPLLRTYEWSVWDQELEKFTNRSVQAPSLNHNFPDIQGGNKCGRLTKSEEESLGEDHPKTLASRLATCNQVFYATVSMEGTNAAGDKVAVKDYPVISYFKRSGFRPAREAVESLTRKGELLNEAVFELGTDRKKQGSVTYYVPVFNYEKSEKTSKDKLDLMKMFLETVKASNNSILEQYKEAEKSRATEVEASLEADFR